jgi:DivIVA domain-containing protein
VASDQPIARRDFPTNRRGYDPAAVDAHLDAVAARVADLERRVAGGASLSTRAGEQVQAIVEAAERGAQDIRAAAEADARERVAKVDEAAERLSGRIDELAAEVAALTSDLKARVRGLSDEVAAIQAQVPGMQPEPAAEPRAPAPPEDLPAAPASGPSGDAAAARIVALDMALSGKPREETERYLAEHYDIPDRDALVDDVYTAAGTA